MSVSEPSPLASPEPWNLVADGYVIETVPHFEKYAAHALALADLAPHSWVLDVAAGPGTLALLAARAGHRVSALDFAPAMLERLRERAHKAGLSVDTELGDGQALPYPDASFEAAFSMFGLMFFPDRLAGLRELHRVLEPGGRAVISSWTPMDTVPILGAMVRAMRDALPDLPFGPGEEPLGKADDMRDELERAGFTGVQVEGVAFVEEHHSVRGMWGSFARGGVPCVLLRKRLGDRAFLDFAEKVVAQMERDFGSGKVSLQWTANVGIGHRP